MADSNIKNTRAGDTPVNEANTEHGYWRSFGELYNSDTFNASLKKEFSALSEQRPVLESMSQISRRRFLALIGASAAFAAAGCSNYRGKGKIIPYNQKPEEITIGIPNYYASTCNCCPASCGILVKTREGRPIKIDGNPEHPVSKGKICAIGQAAIMNLYNPERLKEPMVSTGSEGKFSNTDWDSVNSKITAALKEASASNLEIAIITNPIYSPTFKKLLDEFKSVYPTVKVYSYDIFNSETKRRAWEKCYGSRNLPVINLDKAKVILSLESDFLGNDPGHIEYNRLFSATRDVRGDREFSRLYTVEGCATLTGFNSDYRIRLRTDAIEEFVLCLLNEVISKSNLLTESRIISFVSSYKLGEFAARYSIDLKVLNHLITDLIKHRRESIVIAGDVLPESTHIAVNLLNDLLGNTALYSSATENLEPFFPISSGEEIQRLVYSMSDSKVGVVIHLDTNPVYHFSSDYKYKEALGKVKTVVTMSEMISETCDVSHYVLPVNNQLESWGDYKTRNDFISTQQPLISPLYNTRQAEAIILSWKDNIPYSENIYHDYLKNNWEKNIYAAVKPDVSFNKFWYTVLHDGVLRLSETVTTVERKFSNEAILQSVLGVKPSGGFVLVLQGNNTVGDGRYVSNGWLQELPHPVSKIVWDNYAAISVQSASELGVDTNDMIEIAVDGKKQSFPVFVQPGMADKVIEVSLGYGRTSAGIVGTGVGVNAGVLVSSRPSLSPRLYNNITVIKTTGQYQLASTQEHYPIDSDPLLKDIHLRRGIIREGTWNEYKKDPKFLRHEIKHLDLSPINKPPVYATEGYTGYKWGMVIDLNKCTGCGECIVACNVENNIPVVGKDQVIAEREMMWLRVDRYYSGTPEEPKASFQPMLCQHCDYAPCENVCPVAATTHSEDGLNGMTYNRCVGTRYCSNNCPYKVRRFNYFDFRDHFKDSYQYEEPFDLLANPEVTIRSRGVMEKCTFCVQRIMKERQDAIEQKRNVIGSNVTTACQDACPTNAIVFGDVNDKDSEVAKYREHELGYTVLEEIKVGPNVTYIARLRNVFESES